MGEITNEFRRDEALDATKGIAILAVATFHMWRGLIVAGRIPETSVHLFADALAYGFHIQTFLIISGYLAYPGANRLQAQLRRQSWLYYAYLLWSLLTWGSTFALSGVVNSPANLTQLFSIPYVPFLEYWFLLALMQGLLLIGLLRGSTALLAGCAALVGLSRFLYLMPAFFNNLGPVLFVLIGAWLRASGLKPSVNLAAGLVCMAVFASGAWQVFNRGSHLLLPYHLAYELCGCYAAYVFGARLVAVRWIGPFLCLCGRQSLAIYLMHVFAGAGTRVALAHLAPQLPGGIVFVIVIVAAVTGPLLVARLAALTRTGAMLGLSPLWPDRPRSVPVPLSMPASTGA